MNASNCNTSLINRTLHVMGANLPPFASFLNDKFYSGIEYNLLRLISEKLKRPIQFEYLDETRYHEQQQVFLGNSSESFAV